MGKLKNIETDTVLRKSLDLVVYYKGYNSGTPKWKRYSTRCEGSDTEIPCPLDIPRYQDINVSLHRLFKHFYNPPPPHPFSGGWGQRAETSHPLITFVFSRDQLLSEVI